MQRVEIFDYVLWMIVMFAREERELKNNLDIWNKALIPNGINFNVEKK